MPKSPVDDNKEPYFTRARYSPLILSFVLARVVPKIRFRDNKLGLKIYILSARFDLSTARAAKRLLAFLLVAENRNTKGPGTSIPTQNDKRFLGMPLKLDLIALLVSFCSPS